MASLVVNVQYCMMCVWQVFLREVERQRLQDLLHQEVLRRIVSLQRRFRALLERKHFIRMRQAACQIQVRLGSMNDLSGKPGNIRSAIAILVA